MMNPSGTPRIAATVLVLITLVCPQWSVSVAAQSSVYVIRGATIHTLAGEPIERGTVVIREGLIAAVGVQVDVPSGAEVINGTGLDVYPGLTDSVSQIGLAEVSSVAATVDTVELGDFNPHLQAATAVHAASEHIPVARANGITHAVSAPGNGATPGGFRGGGGFGLRGQASMIHLAGWTIEEMQIEPSVAMVLSWPSLRARPSPGSFQGTRRSFREAKKEYDEQIAQMREWFESARHYAQAQTGGPSASARDLKLEALARVVAGDLPLMVVAMEERDIRNAVAFAEEEGIALILAGGAEAWRVKELLAEKNIPVILGPTQSLPRREDDPYDKPFTNAFELHAAGVQIAFATFNSSSSRTLPYEVGHAVAYGLPWEEGIKAITRSPAEILGVADRLGTIEEGKIANLIVTDGDPLEIRTQIKYLFIKGEPTSTDNRHLTLYERYRARP